MNITDGGLGAESQPPEAKVGLGGSYQPPGVCGQRFQLSGFLLLLVAGDFCCFFEEINSFLGTLYYEFRMAKGELQPPLLVTPLL